jgi:hypothetical protein
MVGKPDTGSFPGFPILLRASTGTGDFSASQPVIPGHDDAALSLAKRAALAGAKHISFKYLKIATEEKLQTLNRISAATGENVWDVIDTRRNDSNRPRLHAYSICKM